LREHHVCNFRFHYSICYSDHLATIALARHCVFQTQQGSGHCVRHPAQACRELDAKMCTVAGGVTQSLALLDGVQPASQVLFSLFGRKECRHTHYRRIQDASLQAADFLRNVCLVPQVDISFLARDGSPAVKRTRQECRVVWPFDCICVLQVAVHVALEV